MIRITVYVYIYILSDMRLTSNNYHNLCDGDSRTILSALRIPGRQISHSAASPIFDVVMFPGMLGDDIFGLLHASFWDSASRRQCGNMAVTLCNK